MSAEATGYVYRYSPFKGATFAVHLAMADVVSDVHDNEFWARQTYLADKARVSRRSITTAISELTDAGYVTCLEDNSRKGFGSANRYRFEFLDTPEVWSSTVRNRCAQGAQPGDTLGAQPLRTLEEPNDNPTEPMRSSSQIDYIDGAFAACWHQYPPQRRVEKKAAHKAFTATVRRCGLAVVEDLGVATRNFAAAMDRKEPRFVKHAATFYGPNEPWRDWLNGNPETDGRANGGTLPTPDWMRGGRL